MVRAPPPPPPWVLALLVSSSLVSMASAVTVMGWVGQPVTLPCQYAVRTSSEVNPVCWGRGGCPYSQCSDPLIQTDQRRVTWRKHDRYQLQGALTSGEVSLTIMGANEADSGTYCCRIDVPGWFNDVKNNIELQMRKLPTTTTTTTRTTRTTTPVPTTTTTTTTTTATTTPRTTTPVPTTTTTTTTTTAATTTTPTTTTELTTTEASPATTSVSTTMEQTTLSTIITTIMPTTDAITPTTVKTAIATTVPPTTVFSTVADTTLKTVPTTTPTALPAITSATEPISTTITTPKTTASNTLLPASLNISAYQTTNEMKYTQTNMASTISRTKVASTIIDAQTVTDLMTASTPAPTIISSAAADINIPTENNNTQPISMEAPTSTTPTVMSSNNTQTTAAILVDSTGAPTTGHGLTVTVSSMVSDATSIGPPFNFTKIPVSPKSFITTATMTPRYVTTSVVTDINEPNATRTPIVSHTARIGNSTEPLPPTELAGTLSSDDTGAAMTSTESPNIWTMEPADVPTEYTTETIISERNESSLGDQMPIKSTSLLSSSSLIAVVCGSVALFVLILLFGLRVRSKIWNKYHLDKTERFWADGRPVELFNCTLQERDETANIFAL